MAKSKSSPKPSPKLTLSASRDIPFDKLVLSQANVRRALSEKVDTGFSRKGAQEDQKAGVSIEELAEGEDWRAAARKTSRWDVLKDERAADAPAEPHRPRGPRRERRRDRHL